jgi:hypothetical protein
MVLLLLLLKNVSPVSSAERVDDAAEEVRRFHRKVVPQLRPVARLQKVLILLIRFLILTMFSIEFRTIEQKLYYLHENLSSL